jgi:hypothetical protein
VLKTEKDEKTRRNSLSPLSSVPRAASRQHTYTDNSGVFPALRRVAEHFLGLALSLATSAITLYMKTLTLNPPYTCISLNRVGSLERFNETKLEFMVNCYYSESY